MVRLNHLDTGRNWWPLLVILIQSAPVRRGLAKTQKVVDKVLGGLLIGLGIKVALG